VLPTPAYLEEGYRMTSPRWKRRRMDRPGAISAPTTSAAACNLLTPEKVRQGVAEVREGLTFCLSLPLEYPGGNVLNPRRHRRWCADGCAARARTSTSRSARRCRTRPT
jgi:hypothetical protein